ncbi:MAG: hypothetical protein ACXACX_21590, partial [Candidatus Hodarchaeales archaeon]
MDIHIKIRMDDYAGFLAFLSEELLSMKRDKEVEGFFAFRYKTPNDKDTERVLVSIKGYNKEFEDRINNKISNLIKKGIILGVEDQGWNFDQYVFGEKGLELAKDIFDLGTEFAISMREKFGKLL